MAKVTLAGRTIQLPKSRLLRILIGLAFIVFGLVGFLPVVGFWMVPVGLVVLSVDSPVARRLRRRSEVAIFRRLSRWRRRG